MKIVLWLLFIALVLIMGQEGLIIEKNAGPSFAIFKLEFANCDAGKAMLCLWQSKPYGAGTLLTLARSGTHTDFLFIFTYTLLLIIYSNSQMQRERVSWLNTLLRLNLFLAVLAGLLDISENLILLYDMRHVAEPGRYVSSQIVSAIKWGFVAWAVLVWLVSIIHTSVTGNVREGHVPVIAS